MTDDELLQHYIQITEVLGEMFAPILEVLVFDLRTPNKSVIAIKNGHITNRKIGHPTSDLGSRRLKKGDVPDVLINYANQSPIGQHLKSSSLAIRNKKGRLIGVLSLNMDISHFEEFGGFINSFISAKSSPFISKKERVHMYSPKKAIKAAVQTALIDIKHNPKSLSKNDKKEIIKYLYMKGHFKKRGIVTSIAKELQITRASVYRYLKELNIAHVSRNNQ